MRSDTVKSGFQRAPHRALLGACGVRPEDMSRPFIGIANMRSDTVKSGFQRAPHRALLGACGVRPEDMSRPFIGIANSFCEIVPGHVHLNA